MGSTLEEKLQRLSPERRKKIEERTALLIAEETTRQRLRQLFKISQEQMGQIIQVDVAATKKDKKNLQTTSDTCKLSIRHLQKLDFSQSITSIPNSFSEMSIC